MPESKEESALRINEALNILRIVKKRELWNRVGEEHVDRIVHIVLIQRNENKFEAEWSKIKALQVMQANTISVLDDSDDLEVAIDFNKTKEEEAIEGSLEQKKIFLANFLNRKLVEIGNQRSAARNLRIVRTPSSTFKIKKGDSVFHVSVQDSIL